MPISKNAFTRYRVIDSTLRNNGFVKTKDLISKFRDIYDLNVGATTINKDIREMKNDSRLGFYAPIEYSAREKAYFYPEDVDNIFPAIEMQEEEVNALVFYSRTFSHYKDFGIFRDYTNAIDKIVDAVNIQSSNRKVSDKIIIQPENFPKFKGSELIPEIISGFDKKCKFSFDYQKHIVGPLRNHIVTPILLKEYDHLWYLLAQIEGRDFITTFALDRILNFNVLASEREIISGFDPNIYFEHAFGIAVPNGAVEDVILEFESWRGRYLLSAPIHKTQELIKEEDDKMQFRFRVIPFYELYAKILSYGEYVKVISPKSLHDEIRNILERTLKNY